MKFSETTRDRRDSASGIWSHPASVAVTCARGLEGVLRSELEGLGFAPAGEAPTVVEVCGTLRDCMRLNLWLRTAHRVLWLWKEFPARSAEDLYRGVAGLPWEEVLRLDQPLNVRAANQADEEGVSTAWMALKCKDAIVDRMRVRLGRRPDSGSTPKGACVFLLRSAGRFRLYLDTTGVPLSFRGYRQESVEAPLRESLAAGLLLASGWTGRTPLVNPMCGSGTIAIEGAGIASRRAPGLQRSRFAFTSLRGFPREEWEQLREAARREVRPIRIPIVAADWSREAVEIARRNARRAGVENAIRFEVAELDATPVPGPRPWIVLNPEYGHRTRPSAEELEELYHRIGQFLRRHGQGGRGVIITGHLALSRRFGLKLARKWTVFNGPIECRVVEFELSGPE